MQLNTSFSGHVEAMLASHRARLFALQYERVIATQPSTLADRIGCEIERLVASINRLRRAVAAGPIPLAGASFPLADPRAGHLDCNIAGPAHATLEAQIHYRHITPARSYQRYLISCDGVLIAVARNP